MMKIPIRFTQVDEMVRFVELLSHFPFPMDLASGKRIVDAKSLMGVLAIGHALGLSLIVHEHPSLISQDLLAELAAFT